MPKKKNKKKKKKKLEKYKKNPTMKKTETEVRARFQTSIVNPLPKPIKKKNQS